jgi:putative PIN family toxin of toxin-antitoxin system
VKIVLDTNVFVSGIFWSGPPYQILKAWQSGQISLVLSQEILDEYDRVSKSLSHKYPGIDLSAFIELVTINAELYVVRKLDDRVSRDPDDDKFIACALHAEVKTIVSGDEDLLTISGYAGITVLKPASFVRLFLK